MTERLRQSFYARPARVVAQALLGQQLVRLVDGQRVGGLIVETEAYCDSEEPDLACHGTANRGRPTPRTEVMFGPPGRAYVYFTYGLHWLFNVVTGVEGEPNAVLVRALEPREGEAVMARRREGRPRPEWTNGPAKLTQALAIDGALHGANLCTPDRVVWIERGIQIAPADIARGPRIGLGKTPEPWRSVPWRYWIRDNRWVSK
ncbi:MAG: DNA-3-methyladenine glycosylase [Candidatus Promineifilaceae bacterium]|nr:DNA-3-methyladenine glycosylase [Candidatus Promineifilaceae bacterium]